MSSGEKIRQAPRHLKRFLQMLFFHFLRDGGSQNAAALTYTTLLSLVPLMAVVLALFSVFPISSQVSDEINNFIFNNFVPAAGEVVQEHLQTFSGKAGRLSGFGFISLLIVSLLLMASIERAFNAIWHLQRKRSLLHTFIVYWAILSLGPVLIAGSVAATSYLVSLPFISDAAQSFGFVRRGLLALMPIAVSTFAFTLLYSVLPNQRISFKHALIGGLVAALLFEGSKRGFALYLTQFPTYEAIYGALAAIPIFLVWLYLSWLVTLLGAEVVYCLGIYHDDWQPGGDKEDGRFLLAYRLLKQLWQAQHQGETLSSQALANQQPGTTEADVEQLLLTLQKSQFVLRSEDRSWALARDLNEVSLSDLYRCGRFILPSRSATDEERLSTLLEGTEQLLSDSMSATLAELFSSASTVETKPVKPRA